MIAAHMGWKAGAQRSQTAHKADKAQARQTPDNHVTLKHVLTTSVCITVMRMPMI